MRMTPTFHGFSPFTALTGAKFSVPIPVSEANSPDIKTIVQKLQQIDSSLMSCPTNSSAQTNRRNSIPKELHTCSHVWLRIDRVKKPLEAPYTGPHQVIGRNIPQGTFNLDINGQEKVVSMNRLKPCNQRINNETLELMYPSPTLTLLPERYQTQAPSSSGYDSHSHQSPRVTPTTSGSSSPDKHTNHDSIGSKDQQPQVNTQPKVENPALDRIAFTYKVPQSYREQLYGKAFQKIPPLKDHFQIDIKVKDTGQQQDTICFEGPKSK